MAEMGVYCKAYPVSALAGFEGWQPKLAVEPERLESGEELAYAFIQQDYTVTRGVFLGEDVVFDDITPEWRAFCETTLAFEVPRELLEEPADAFGGENTAPAA
jgi:hypothetical protein